MNIAERPQLGFDGLRYSALYGISCFRRSVSERGCEKLRGEVHCAEAVTEPGGDGFWKYEVGETILKHMPKPLCGRMVENGAFNAREVDVAVDRIGDSAASC